VTIGLAPVLFWPAVVRAVRGRLTRATVEVLVPDFGGDGGALEAALHSPPSVFGHNVETVPRLYGSVCSSADYERSLALLREVKTRGGTRTKSGLMVGLGETRDEALAVMVDLRQVNCDLLTIGQYLPPSRAHLPAARFVPPEEFTELAAVARGLGFAAVAAGPLVRSSYRAAALLAEAVGSSSLDPPSKIVESLLEARESHLA
jgi:lipoic acid synthetase